MADDPNFHLVRLKDKKLYEAICSYCFTRLAASPRPEVLRIIEQIPQVNRE